MSQASGVQQFKCSCMRDIWFVACGTLLLSPGCTGYGVYGACRVGGICLCFVHALVCNGGVGHRACRVLVCGVWCALEFFLL